METITKRIKESDCFFIAELGLNHDGSFGNALRLVEEAKNAGVDGVKFQLHISKEERVIGTPTPQYFKYETRDQYFNRTNFSKEEWKRLKNYAHELGLYFIVSPFSHKAVDILQEVGVDAYKIASGETTNIPLLEYINSKNSPVLLSTGMSNWEEIANAVDVLKENLIVLFQCSSQYPCLAKNIGLNIITEMIDKYNKSTIGYSDHTPDNFTAIAAFMKGAKVFEKHFTLSKKMYGPDAGLSLEPEELKYYIAGIKFVSNASKNLVDKNNIDLYYPVKVKYEKSIVASRDLNKDHILTIEDLDYKKPGDAIRADRYKELLGKKLIKNLKKDKKILFEHLN